MLSTSPRQATSIRAERGYPLAVKLAFTKSDDSPMDLATCMLLFYMTQPEHKGGEAIDTGAEITLDTPTTLGRALLYMQGEGLELEPDVYPFHISITPMYGLATIVVKGELEIVANSNLVGVPDFTEVSPASEISVKLADRNRIIVRTNHLPDRTLVAYTNLAASSASQAGIYAEQAAASADAAADSAAAAEAAAESSGSATAAAAAASAASDSSADSAEISANQAADSSAAAAVSASAAAAGAAAAATAAASAAAADASADEAAISANIAEAAIQNINDFTKGDTGEQGEKGDTGLTGDLGIVRVHHGAVGSVARPVTTAIVYWVGTATPVNAMAYDMWLREDI